MGRKERRKQNKVLRDKLTNSQFEKLYAESNKEYVNLEVKKQIHFYQSLWSDSLLEAFAKHGIGLTKQKIILEDVGVIMARRAEEKGVKVDA